MTDQELPGMAKLTLIEQGKPTEDLLDELYMYVSLALYECFQKGPTKTDLEIIDGYAKIIEKFTGALGKQLTPDEVAAITKMQLHSVIHDIWKPTTSFVVQCLLDHLARPSGSLKCFTVHAGIESWVDETLATVDAVQFSRVADRRAEPFMAFAFVEAAKTITNWRRLKLQPTMLYRGRYIRLSSKPGESVMCVAADTLEGLG